MKVKQAINYITSDDNGSGCNCSTECETDWDNIAEAVNVLIKTIRQEQKGIQSLLLSRKKWKDRYYKLKSSIREKELINTNELMDIDEAIERIKQLNEQFKNIANNTR